jgi:hypothetical protein
VGLVVVVVQAQQPLKVQELLIKVLLVALKAHNLVVKRLVVAVVQVLLAVIWQLI